MGGPDEYTDLQEAECTMANHLFVSFDNARGEGISIFIEKKENGPTVLLVLLGKPWFTNWQGRRGGWVLEEQGSVVYSL